MSMNMYPYNPYLAGTAYTNPYIPQQVYNPMSVNPVVQPQGPRMEIQSVNGKESAYAFSMGPNSSVILADALNPKIWIVTTDSSGYKAVKGFKITPDDEPETVVESKTIENDPIPGLIERINKLEERMNSIGQSNSRSSWQSKPGNGNVQQYDRNGQSGKGSDGNS